MKKERPFSMIYHGLALVLFAFALMQLNDPDYLVWIPVYLLPCAMCILAARGRHHTAACLVNCLLYSAGGIWLWPEEFKGLGTMKEMVPQVEQGREALGLIFSAIIWLGLHWSGRKAYSDGSQRKSR
jgi:hypothetical protein